MKKNIATKSKKILLAEDEADLAEIFSLKLREAGFEVLLATNGRVAWDLAKNDKPNLILLDLVMPEMDGYKFLEQRRTDPQINAIPTYAWSNLTQKDEIDKARKLGATDYLIKTDFTPTKLVETMREVLGLKK